MKKLTLLGGETATRMEVDFSEIIQQVAKLYEPLVKRCGVDLHLCIKGKFPVWGNPEERTQVVFNILQNAKEHIESGSVSISAVHVNECIVVTCADTGTGIASELLPR